MNILRMCCIAMTVGTLCIGLSAQSRRPSFAVVSVTRVAADRLPLVPREPKGSYLGVNTLDRFISFAYDIAPSKVIGGPEWVRSVKFRIDARSAGPATMAETRLMLQSLLEERFQLVVRNGTEANLLVVETAELPPVSLSD